MKFWKVRYDSDIKLILEKLQFDNNLIKIYLEEDSDFYKCMQTSGYILLSVDSKTHGWNPIDCIDWYISQGYTYAGEITLRKEKLERLMLRK
jgi:hypothetical protein